MEYELGALRPQELTDLGELANRVFRPNGGDMVREYPLLMTPENAENLRVARAEIDGRTRIVSHVGICLRDVTLLGAKIRVASIGAVCTDPDLRGEGLASKLMEDAREHAVSRGASLMLISGGRGLYRRLGYIPAGSFPVYRFPVGEATDPEVTAGMLGGSDMPAIIAMQQCEPVRFRRPLEDWRKLLRAERLMNQPGDLWTVRSGGRMVAYVAVQRPREKGRWARAMEIAGSRRVLAAAAPAIAQHYKAPGLEVVAPASDEPAGLGRELGNSEERILFPGTVGIIDSSAFLRAIRPLIAERTDGSLELEPSGEGALVRAGGDEVELPTMAQLTTLVFGSELEYQAALPGTGPVQFAILGGILPLPLPWYGYNYV